MRPLLALAALACAALAPTSALAATAALLSSEAGDPVGQGQEQNLEPPDWIVSARLSDFDPSTVYASIRSDSRTYFLHFTVPAIRPFGRGNYGRALSTASSPQDRSSLEVSMTDYGGGGQCSGGTSGWFEVSEFVLSADGKVILRMAIDFLQRCEHVDAALHGALRINSSVPMPRHRPNAIVDGAHETEEHEVAPLDGSQSFSRLHPPLTYRWEQTEGPAVAIDHPDAAMTGYEAPEVPPGGADLRFRLTVTDARAAIDEDELVVHVHDDGDLRSAWSFDSELGDPVGLGRRVTGRPGLERISARSTIPGRVMVRIDGDHASEVVLDPLPGRALVVGKYAGAMKSPPHLPNRPGLAAFLPGGVICSSVTGGFEVLESDFDPGRNATRFAADFVQYCNGANVPLVGALRINSSLPLRRTGPLALAGVDFAAPEGVRVRLRGVDSRDRGGSPLTYRWSQLAGTPVVIGDPHAVSPAFRTPALVRPGGEDLEFELVVTNAEGETDADRVTVHVISRSDAQTTLRMTSDFGDVVGGGRAWSHTDADSLFESSVDFHNGVFVFVAGLSEAWSLAFANGLGTPLLPGSYEAATRYDHEATGSPGMAISGRRSCAQLTGRFDVIEAAYSQGVLQRFAASFEQHCNGDSPALRGEVRYRHQPSGLPVADAGEDRIVIEGRTVVLDGSGSSDADGYVRGYQWRQTAGPPVALSLERSRQTRFTAPQVDGSQPMTFELMVTDDERYRALDTVTITVVDGP